ncbi:MAG TPA: hypothetical protein VM571_13415 [Noviherbaspirillum sp.]|nr:hypothetical protein [Noviherbaspirillum sp.]
MAINETPSGRMESVREVNVIDESSRRQVFPAIRWGAVLAGVAVGISIQLVLTLLGIATGISSTQVTQGEVIGMGPLIWAGFSMLIAAFVGGYVAARMSGLKRKADGVLHGAVSWAVTTILFVLLATSIGGSLVGGVFSSMSQMAQTSAANGESPLAALMRSQGSDMNPETLKQLQQHLQAGERDQAVQLVTNSMNIEPQRAEAIVDQALIVSGSPERASPQGRQTTQQAMQAAGSAAWVIFLAVALALAIGIGGGALGAAGSRRVSWGAAAPRH